MLPLRLVLVLQEYERRFLVWLDNMEYAHAHNEKESSFKVHHPFAIHSVIRHTAVGEAWALLEIHGRVASAEEVWHVEIFTSHILTR